MLHSDDRKFQNKTLPKRGGSGTDPDPKHVSTSFSGRQNLSMRMGNRRMTRLTNAFSKKAANHAHMMAIYFMH